MASVYDVSTHRADSSSLDFNFPVNFCRWRNRHKNSRNQNKVEQGERSRNKPRSFCQEESHPISYLGWFWARRHLQESNCSAKVRPSVFPSVSAVWLLFLFVCLPTFVVQLKHLHFIEEIFLLFCPFCDFNWTFKRKFRTCLVWLCVLLRLVQLVDSILPYLVPRWDYSIGSYASLEVLALFSLCFVIPITFGRL